MAGLLLLLLTGALGQLLAEQERTLCTLETQRLYHCGSYTSPKSLLTPKQQQICCDAVRSLHEDGCFWCAAAQKLLRGSMCLQGIGSSAAGTAGHAHNPCMLKGHLVARSGWGAAAAMNPWTRDVLLDLASVHQACTGSAVSCPCGERRSVCSDCSSPYGYRAWTSALHVRGPG